MAEDKDKLFHGRQVAAARVLAGIGVRELASAAAVTPRTVHRIETGGVVRVADGKRHGYVSGDVWGRIALALKRHGVELTPASGEHGLGVRWVSNEHLG